ncbi:MAG: hypothetical protein WCT31_02085 [Candidatus Micrarchaeia archaeon]
MAKAIDYVIELNKEEARLFLVDRLNPRPNKERDATIERAKNLRIEVRE